MLLGVLSVNAESVNIEGVWYNLIVEGKTAEVTRNPDAMTVYTGTIVVPSAVTYDGVTYAVTGIGEGAFRDSENLTSVTLGAGLTGIGRAAFMACRNLASITIPSGVTVIEEQTFAGCEKLSTVVLPEGLTSIGEMAFAECLSLTSISIPDAVTSIGAHAFAHCEQLGSLTLSESVTSIGEGAFRDCGGELTVNCNVSDWMSAFEGSGFTKVTVGDAVTGIGEGAFSGSENLTSVTLGSGLTGIGPAAFMACRNLASITIPSGVAVIEERTFAGCEKLSTVVLPEGLTSIGEMAFAECLGLTSISIPDAVTSIGEGAFRDCEGLTSVVIPGGLKFVRMGTFENCRNLTSVVVLEGVKSLEANAFAYCESLASISLPESVVKIEDNAFANCSELRKVCCYATEVPVTSEMAFVGSYPEFVTLFVPVDALESYKGTAPWSGFGKYETLDGLVDEIEISHASVTLTKGEYITLTATVTPVQVVDGSVSWNSSNPSVATVDAKGKVKAILPGKAVITVTANDGSGVSASCELTVQDVLGKCEAPVIVYSNGKLQLESDTEGATIVTEVMAEDAKVYMETEIDLAVSYAITAYATKSQYENSEIVNLTICWVECTENHDQMDGPTDDVIAIPTTPVLIQTVNGSIALTGLVDGTAVEAYDMAGHQVGFAVSESGTATINTNLSVGSTVIVKIGHSSVKVLLR